MHGIVVAVDYPGNSRIAPNDFRQRHRIKCQQQFVLLRQVVPVDRARGDELCRSASPLRWHPLHRMDYGSEFFRLNHNIERQPPLRVPQ